MEKFTVIYGIHSVAELIHTSPTRVRTLYYVAKQALSERVTALLANAKQQNISCCELTSKQFIHQFPHLETLNHQGVVAEAKIKLAQSYSVADIVRKSSSPPVFLILDCITDPHNLGACLRSAEAAGVSAVIVPKDKSVKVTDVVRKVACGAAELVPVITVTNLVRTMHELQDLGVWIIGMDAGCDQPLYSQDLTGAIALVLGSEGKGMRQLTRKSCDFVTSIPMIGTLNSLNVSVAAGISLFEVTRQRLQHK